jgi:hypothetical protein
MPPLTGSFSVADGGLFDESAEWTTCARDAKAG